MPSDSDDDSSSLQRFQTLLPKSDISNSTILISIQGAKNTSSQHGDNFSLASNDAESRFNPRVHHPPKADKDNCYSWLLHGRERKVSEGAFSTDSSTSSSSSSSSSFLSLPLPPPPDGGWGWMVVLGAFIVLFICDGLAYCFGILYHELLLQFEESRSKTSLVGSIFFGVSMILGPFASAMTTRFGCRNMTIIGGILSFLGFILSVFVSSIEMLCITFGVIVGVGFSFCYVTSAVIVHFYFDKRRSLATGLAVCGTGVGTFTFAPLMEYVISEYGWQGLFLIMAGISLNLVVAGMLFIPLKFTEEERWQHYFTEFDKLPHVRESLELGKMRHASECTEFSSDYLDCIEEESRTMSMLSLPTFMAHSNTMTDPSSEVVLREALRNSKNPHLTFHRYMKNAYFRSGGIEKPEKILPGKRQDETYTISDNSNPLESQSDSLLDDSFRELKGSTSNVIRTKNTLSGGVHQSTQNDNKLKAPSNMKLLQIKGNLNKSSSFMDINSTIKSKSASRVVSGINMGKHNVMCTQLLLYRNDVFYRRYCDRAAQNNRQCLFGTSCPELTEPHAFPDVEAEGRFHQSVKSFFKGTSTILMSMVDLSLFKNVFFTVFVISNVMFYFWNDIPYMFAADHAVTKNISIDNASFLISIIGIFNAVGQLVFGVVGDMDFNLVNLFAVCMFVSGLLTAVIPFMEVYWSMALVYALFGFVVSVNFPFVSVLLVNYLGVEQLTDAYGLLMLMQGVANIVGPPVAGLISDITHSYDSAFYLSGIFFALSGLVMYIIFIPQCQVQKVALEKVISASPTTENNDNDNDEDNKLKS